MKKIEVRYSLFKVVHMSRDKFASDALYIHGLELLDSPHFQDDLIVHQCCYLTYMLQSDIILTWSNILYAKILYLVSQVNFHGECY